MPHERLRQALREDPELADALHRAWTLVEAADLVADLWSVLAYLHRCAPWLTPEQVQRLQRADPYAWTTADLPLLDAARSRLGDPEGSMQLLRRQSIRDSLVDEAAAPSDEPDRLAGPFAHVVVDEAQELTDAGWQMLLRRCPSRSFTIVGDRAQARRDFAESWSQRLERIGLDPVRVATLTTNYRTPAEIMAEAEPVIRAVVLGADQVKGLEFDLVVLVDPPVDPSAEPSVDPDGPRPVPDRAAAVDRYVAMTRATQQLVVLSGS